MTNFRTSWDHTNLHLEHVTGNPSKHFTGYHLILKAEDGNRLLEVTEKNTISYDRALTIVSEWMNHPANRDRLPKANR